MFKSKTIQNPVPEIVAAVDLGSNSFHMIVVRVLEDYQIKIIDRLKEMVRLAAGLDENKNITEDAQAGAIACLERFGQRLREMPPGSVRAVGTNTLRSARNAQEFLAKAEAALGHPIQIIAGREEARLIYQGVSQSLSDSSEQRLVMDIGGGSTEFIIGRRHDTIRRESLFMGCVTMSRRHFTNGVIKAKAMRRAEIDARLELQAIAGDFQPIEWERAVGASGTIKAVGKIVEGQGWSKRGITYRSLQKLRSVLLDAGHLDKIQLKELNPERAPVFVGGAAILIGAFEELEIERMEISEGALREGLVYDFIGRIAHHDVRENTIRKFMQRYEVNSHQAEQVENSAALLLQEVAQTWNLRSEEHESMLRWSARLHEIGLALAHNQYHKHAYYILVNSDLAGFSRQEQNLLATLIRGHRRKFPLETFKKLPVAEFWEAVYLCVLLRLAVLLHRGRYDLELPELKLRADNKQLSLAFPPDWLEQHPLTQADLVNEQNYLSQAGINLEFS